MATFTLSDLYQSGGAAASFSNEQRFTASGTFIVPENVYRIYVTAVGGGGGGASGRLATGYTTAYWGGGAGAWCYMVPLLVTPGQSIVATVGAGGLGGAAVTGRNDGGNFGQNGGDTIFDSLRLSGGTAGASSVVNNAPYVPVYVNNTGAGRAGGQYTASSNPSIAVPLRAGTDNPLFLGGLAGDLYHNTSLGSTGNVYAGGGGGGAGSILGAGGNGTDGRGDQNTSNAANASGYGAGGGTAGSVGWTSTNRTAGKGGNGSPGIIIVNW